MKKSGRPLLAVLLLFVGLVLINYLAASLPVRLDVTSEKIYTLSPGTKALLAKIEEPIAIEFYFTRSASGLPIAAKNYADRVQEILRQYARSSNGRVRISVIDPRPDTPEEERASAAGLTAQSLGASGEQLVIGIVAIQAGEQRAIPMLDPRREPFLEYDLSELIASVQQLDRKKIGVLSGLPVQETQNRALVLQGRGEPGQYVAKEWSNSFELVAIDPAVEQTLPEGIEALALIHPPPLRPALQYAIDQFILAGHPVFVAVDPSSVYNLKKNAGLTMFGAAPIGTSSDLPVLLKAYGVDYSTDLLVGDPEHASLTTGSDGGPVRVPVWMTLGAENFNHQSQPLAQISKAVFGEAGVLAAREGSRTTFTPLITTSDQSGTIPAEMTVSGTPEQVARAIRPSGKKTIAALVTGKFPSAFPDGPPPEEAAPDAGAPKPPAPPAAAGLKESKTSSTLFVIADADWLMDGFAVVKRQILSQVSVSPIYQNLALASNVMEFLGGSSDLISIRGKGVAERPFAVVRAMEVEANRKYQEKLDALEKRLSEIQDRISQLMGQNGDQQRLVATPETTKAIEEFRKEQATVRAERREISRALREGIDALENRLLAVNLAVAPVCLCAFGLWFHRRRRG